MAGFLTREGAGIMPDMERASATWYNMHQREQRRWDNSRDRLAYEDAARFNREDAIGRTNRYNQAAGLFTENTDLAGMGPRSGVPQATAAGVQSPVTAGATPTGAATETGAATPAAPGAQPRGYTPTSLNSQELDSVLRRRHRGGSVLAPVFTEQEIASNPTIRSILQRGQQFGQLIIEQEQNAAGETVYRVARRERGTVDEQNFQGPNRNNVAGPNNLPLAGMDLGVIFGAGNIGSESREYNADLNHSSRTTNTELPGAATTEAGLTTPTSETDTATGATTGTGAPGSPDPYHQGSPDTSMGLQPTREMQLLNLATEDYFARAQMAARHGRNDIADEAFAAALQGRASYYAQENLMLFRNAAQGSRAASERLIANMNGVPDYTDAQGQSRPSVRLQPTDEAQPRFILQSTRDNGATWTSVPGVPMTQEQLFSSMQALVDPANAAARAEAQGEVQRIMLENQGRLAIATVEQETAILRMLSEQEIAQLRAATDLAVAAGGRPEMLQNAETGTVILRYPAVNEQTGQIEHRVEILRLEDVQTANVDGRQETTQQYTRTNVATGVPNVRAN